MATTSVPLRLPEALPHYNRENEDQCRRAIERAMSLTVSRTENVGVGLADIADYGASGGYIRSNGSAWVRTTGVAATDLTGTVASARLSGSYIGITGLGTITVGVWNGTSISTTYTDAKVVSVSGTSNRITSTGGGTPVLDISASYVGQSSITTLGTITTGVWTGTAIAAAYIGAHTHVFADITDRASAATGITKVGTINTGVWQGTSIATTYTDAKVTSVASRTGAVALTAADIGAGSFPSGTFHFSDQVEIFKAGSTQLTIGYDVSNYFVQSVNSGGSTSWSVTGGSSEFRFNQNSVLQLVLGSLLADFKGDVTVASGKVYKVNGTQVVSAQGATVADASGGVVIDAEARTALNALLARVRAHGLIAT